MNASTTIIPVAGGKGGIGKTFLAANLAIALANLGYATVVVDLDLGGSNLNYFLGLPNKFPGIGDFLKARTAELEALIVSTEIPNLKFIPGDGRTPFMANIPYAQKMRLISRIKKLEAKYIILDLAAGSSFNTLDFFRMSSHGLIVTSTDYVSIMSMMAFLKQLLLRIIERNFARNHEISSLLHDFNKQSMKDDQMNIRALESRIAAIDFNASKKIKELCNKYRPRVVFNMGEHPDEIKLSEKISTGLESNLSIEIDYFGFTFKDPFVQESIKKRMAFLPNFQGSIAAESIVRIAERITKFWDKPVDNSSYRLLNSIKKVYESIYFKGNNR